MKNKKRNLDRTEKTALIITWILRLFMFAAIIISVARMNFFLIFSSVVVLIFSFVPAMISRRFKIVLPIEVDFILAVFLYVHFILGEMQEYYKLFWWFSGVLHLSSGVLFGLLGFVIAYVLLSTHKIKAAPSFVILFTLSLSMATGAAWEIFEYTMDQTLGFNMQKSGLIDTMWDLIANFLGALLISLFGYLYLRYSREGFIKRVIRKVYFLNEFKNEPKNLLG